MSAPLAWDSALKKPPVSAALMVVPTVNGSERIHRS